VGACFLLAFVTSARCAATIQGDPLLIAIAADAAPTTHRMHREIERREKVEEARRETERILAQQEAEVKARKAEMERRDK